MNTYLVVEDEYLLLVETEGGEFKVGDYGWNTWTKEIILCTKNNKIEHWRKIYAWYPLKDTIKLPILFLPEPPLPKFDFTEYIQEAELQPFEDWSKYNNIEIWKTALTSITDFYKKKSLENLQFRPEIIPGTSKCQGWYGFANRGCYHPNCDCNLEDKLERNPKDGNKVVGQYFYEKKKITRKKNDTI